MAGEKDAFGALTLLLAVCDEALDRLQALDPPADGRLTETALRLRHEVEATLRSSRFRQA